MATTTHRAHPSRLDTEKTLELSALGTSIAILDSQSVPPLARGPRVRRHRVPHSRDQVEYGIMELVQLSLYISALVRVCLLNLSQVTTCLLGSHSSFFSKI